MNLLFLYRRQYGVTRYYAVDVASLAIVKISGRKSLDISHLRDLFHAGFEITLKDAERNIEIKMVA